MIKNTSLLAFIGVYEMFLDAEQGYSVTFKPVEYFIGVAFWYLVLTTIWSLIQVQIERKLGASDREEGEGWVQRILGIQAAGIERLLDDRTVRADRHGQRGRQVLRKASRPPRRLARRRASRRSSASSGRQAPARRPSSAASTTSSGSTAAGSR